VKNSTIRTSFNKRIFTAGLLLNDIGFMLCHITTLLGVFRDRAITKPFFEKIMTITTAVNGCVYCAWFHTRQAMLSGISEQEVMNLMNLQFQADVSPWELPALLYAQHFAETNRHPDPDMTAGLYALYGEKTARHIILIVRMIFFGNLYGNTWDAVISRFQGRPAPGSNIIFEMVFFFLNALFMVPVMLKMRRNRKATATGKET